VLMPVYNGEPYLDASIGSILSQTFTDFEFIIVDDGSTDRSLQIIEQFQRRDARIRALSRPNTGIVGALNDGLAIAQGELIARMDADDVAYPPRLERQVAFLDVHPECVAVGAQVRCIDRDGNPVDSGYRVPFDHTEIHEHWHLQGIGGGIPHPTAMLRCAAIRQIGGYRQLIAEDHDLFVRIAEVGRLANLPDVLLDYRIHPQGLSQLHRQRLVLNSCATAVAAHRRRGTRPSAALHRRYAAAALALGDFRTARRQACLGVAARPFSRKSWRLIPEILLCGARPAPNPDRGSAP